MTILYAYAYAAAVVTIGCSVAVLASDYYRKTRRDTP